MDGRQRRVSECRFYAISCPSQSLCVAVDRKGGVVTSTDPADGAAATWSAPTSVDGATNFLDTISCPSVSLCVAADEAGNVVASTDPTGNTSSWTLTNVDTDPLTGQPRVSVGISCAPASTECVAVDRSGHAVASTDPAAASPAWIVSPADPYTVYGNGHPTSVSCPTVSFCAAVDQSGSVLASTNPIAGASAKWTQAAGVDAGAFSDPNCSLQWCTAGDLNAVSCPSLSLCVAVDNSGHIATSTAPSTATPNWQLGPQTVDDYSPLVGISCPSAALCVAVGAGIVSSTDPTNVASWTVKSVAGSSGIDAVSCPSVTFCAAVDTGGNVITSTDPGDGAGATWTVTAENVINGHALVSISCPSASLCVAVDGYNPGNDGAHVVVSTDPTGDATHWTPVLLGLPGLDSVSCPSTSLCVATGEGTGDGTPTAWDNVVSSVNPTGGASAWTAAAINPGGGDNFDSVSCPTTTMCAAITFGGAFTRAVIPHTLTVKKAGRGAGKVTSNPAGISCGSKCAASFGTGTHATLTAAPAAGSRFASWSGGGCSGTARCRMTVTADTTVTATFAKLRCVVPKVKGKTLAAARRAITAAHCRTGAISYSRSQTAAKGTVISQFPAPGRHLAFRAKVSLRVSEG